MKHLTSFAHTMNRIVSLDGVQLILRWTGFVVVTIGLLTACAQQKTETAEPEIWPTAPPVMVIVEITATPAPEIAAEPVEKAGG